MTFSRARKFLLPGENTRMVFIASCIGVMGGLANICFRTVLEFVHETIFVPGYALATQGGWHILLLPLLPISGMVLLIPLPGRCPVPGPASRPSPVRRMCRSFCARSTSAAAP